MREGYCSCLVCVCVCVYLSVTALAATVSVYTCNLREGKLVGRMLLQRLATGMKQARYRRGPARGSAALYAHAQYRRSLALAVQCMV